MTSDLRDSPERSGGYFRAPLWGSARLYSPGETVGERFADGKFYPASRLSARAARAGVRGMLAFGLGATEQPELDELSAALRPWIRGLLPAADREVFIMGRTGASGRAVLVSVSSLGCALSFTKVAWESSAIGMLKREAQLLPLAAAGGLGPAPMGVYEGLGIFALMSEVLPGREPGIRAPVPAELLRRAAKLPTFLPPDQHPAVLACAAGWSELAPRLHALLSGKQYAVGLVHGDAAPWNARIAGGAVKLFDWEYGCRDGFIAADTAHWVLQTKHLIRRSSPAHACEAAAGVLRRGIGLTKAQAHGVCALTALDLCQRLRIEEKRSEAAWWEAVARYALAEQRA